MDCKLCQYGRENGAKDQDASFSSDSEIVSVVDAAAFLWFCHLLDYDQLVDSFDNEPQVNTYVNSLQDALGGKFCAFVCSPGIGFGFEFIDSGRYQINRS
jgi:hypothetical protein